MGPGGPREDAGNHLTGPAVGSLRRRPAPAQLAAAALALAGTLTEAAAFLALVERTALALVERTAAFFRFGTGSEASTALALELRLADVVPDPLPDPDPDPDPDTAGVRGLARDADGTDGAAAAFPGVMPSSGARTSPV